MIKADHEARLDIMLTFPYVDIWLCIYILGTKGYMKMLYVKDILKKEYTNKGHSVARRKVETGVFY